MLDHDTRYLDSTPRSTNQMSQVYLICIATVSLGWIEALNRVLATDITEKLLKCRLN